MYMNNLLSDEGSAFGRIAVSTRWSNIIILVAASFSITKSRSAVIDFSAAYYYTGFAMMSIETESTERRYFSFLEPFPFITWIILMLAAVVSFFCLVRHFTNLNTYTAAFCFDFP